MIRSLTCLAAFAVATGTTLAQPAVKLAVVDMARVYDNHYKTEEANAKFRDADQKAQEQVEELNKQGQAMVEEYKELIEQSKNTVLTADARTRAEAEAQRKFEDIQRKQNDLNQFRTNTRNSLQQRIKTHRDLLLEEISKVVVDLATRQGATLVIDRSGPTLFGISAVVHADPAYDITDAVLAEVNKDRPPTLPAAPGSAGAASPGFTVPGATAPKKP